MPVLDSRDKVHYFGETNADVRKASTNAAISKSGNITVQKNVRLRINSAPRVISVPLKSDLTA